MNKPTLTLHHLLCSSGERRHGTRRSCRDMWEQTAQGTGLKLRLFFVSLRVVGSELRVIDFHFNLYYSLVMVLPSP